MSFNNACQFYANSPGTADFLVHSAVPDHGVPQDLGAIDGKLYRYFARSADETQFENGWGEWDQSALTLIRSEIISTSDGGTAKVEFLGFVQVEVFPSPPNRLELLGLDDPQIPEGTRMLFQQTTAPVNWTKITSHNDKALRVVSGAASSGGVQAFSTVFARTATDGHALTLAETVPHDHGSHSHGTINVEGQPTLFPIDVAAPMSGANTGAAGSGTAHTHGMDIRVQYVDVIIAEWDGYP